MPSKITTTINKIQTVTNLTNAEIIAQLYYYMKGSDIDLENDDVDEFLFTMPIINISVNSLLHFILLSESSFQP